MRAQFTCAALLILWIVVGHPEWFSKSNKLQRLNYITRVQLNTVPFLSYQHYRGFFLHYFYSVSAYIESRNFSVGVVIFIYKNPNVNKFLSKLKIMKNMGEETAFLIEYVKWSLKQTLWAQLLLKYLLLLCNKLSSNGKNQKNKRKVKKKNNSAGNLINKEETSIACIA